MGWVFQQFSLKWGMQNASNRGLKWGRFFIGQIFDKLFPPTGPPTPSLQKTIVSVFCYLCSPGCVLNPVLNPVNELAAIEA